MSNPGACRPTDCWPPGGGIMLGSARDPGADENWSVAPGGFSAYVVTDEPDALFTRATAAGATVMSGSHDTDNGPRDFAVRDPEGNRWSFGTYRGAPRAQSARRVTKYQEGFDVARDVGSS